MVNMKRIVSTSLISVLLIALAVPAFADSNRGQEEKTKNAPTIVKVKEQGPPQFAVDKSHNGFSFMDGKKIKVNDKHLNFDVKPVIKEGRILIPVRAITEGMGADVNWDASSSIVTITSADGDTIIMFYLDKSDNGKVTVNGEKVVIDVKPGMVNNRTFVPLRFIAETLGFDVNHSDKTGEINLHNKDKHDSDNKVKEAVVAEKPSISPTAVKYSTASEISDAVVKVDMNNYKLASVKEVKDGADALVLNTAYTVKGNTITFKESFIKGLDAGKTVLTLVFEAINKELATLNFTIEK